MTIEILDFTLNLLQVILWQYNNATNIQSLINQKQAWYQINQTQFWDDWFMNVFNLATANLFGLTVWSIILDLPLFIQLNPDPPGKPIFGFNEVPTINPYVNFDRGFFSNNENSTEYLTMEQQRLILQLRYYQLVSGGKLPEINSFLNTLFSSSGGAWVLDGLDMSMTTVFNFNIDFNLFYVIQQYDLIARPAGVLMKYVISTGTIFGFNEVPMINPYVNFDRGVFPPEYTF